jgi:hypothetical protein
MQDSFRSFCNADIEKWIINIRGPYKYQAGEFLKNNLGDKLKLYELNSIEGWFFDSRQMLDEINSDYVFFWIEDHLNINKSQQIINNVVMDMKEFNVESLWYSWFHYNKAYRDISKFESNTIEYFDLDRSNFVKVLAVVPLHYIVSCVSILKCSLFKKIINTDDNIIAKKWPKETPFEFEKSHKDLHWLPMRCAILKEELFVPIDDDSEHPGSCLISRGLYPNRLPRALVGIAGGVSMRKSFGWRCQIIQRVTNRLRSLIQKIISTV